MNNPEQDQPEKAFSRLVNVKKIKSRGQRETIEASPLERKELADELSISSVDELSFNCVLLPWKKGGVEIRGQVTATVEEVCVVSLDPFKTKLSLEVKRYFAKSYQAESETQFIDLESTDDELPDVFENDVIDIGDIAVETLALSLSAYPRKPGVVFQDHVESDPESSSDPARENPFDVLQQLKKH